MPTKAPVKLQAKEAIVIVVGARPPIPQVRIVRNKRTNRLEEVPMVPELPYLDEGDEGRTHVFKAGQVVWSDHEAVEACPSTFYPAPE